MEDLDALVSRFKAAESKASIVESRLTNIRFSRDKVMAELEVMGIDPKTTDLEALARTELTRFESEVSAASSQVELIEKAIRAWGE